MALNRIDDGIYVASYRTKIGLGIVFPASTWIVRFEDQLALISPGPIDHALDTELRALGSVTAIIAPNLFHHFYLRSAKERYPAASLLAPPGLAEKKGLNADGEIPGQLAPFDKVLEAELLAGAPKCNEVMFLHRSTRTLLVTDLIFNMPRGDNLITDLVLRSTGARGKPASSRLMKFLVRDRQAAARSVNRVLSWEFDRVLVNHGEAICGGASRRLRDALSWLTDGRHTSASQR